MKDAGFNMLRKHLKVEADRWYYHCDRLGMLVWQDMVSGGGAYDGWKPATKPTLWRGSWDGYEDTSASHQRRPVPMTTPTSAAAGVPRHGDPLARSSLGVTWCCSTRAGAVRRLACAEEVHLLDPTRPIDAVSGWVRPGRGRLPERAQLFRPLAVYRDRRDLTGYARLAGGRAFTISEFGGLVHAVADHSAFAGTYGYGATDTPAEWRTEACIGRWTLRRLWEAGLSAYVYHAAVGRGGGGATASLPTTGG